MLTDSEIITIEPGIYYIPDTEQPLSSNVVIIEGEEALWLYDVGRGNGVETIINRINKDNKKINIVLSHFHGDHIGNLQLMHYDRLIQGRETFRHTRQGEVIDDGEMHIHIFRLPSSHAKGCVALEVNEKYCFLGDAAYPGVKKDKNGAMESFHNPMLLRQEAELLKHVKADKFMLSHSKPFLRPKAVVIRMLENYKNSD